MFILCELRVTQLQPEKQGSDIWTPSSRKSVR